VAVDTSGSISSHELSIFFQEIDEIWRQGALVTVVECDAKVQAHYRYDGKAPAKINGRGGTAFDPIFSFINQSVVRYDGCIYLSDGEAQKPKIRPRCRLLWVITANGTTLNTDFGRTVVLSEK
jgi:predicted metal-dependent peptidase